MGKFNHLKDLFALSTLFLIVGEMVDTENVLLFYPR